MPYYTTNPAYGKAMENLVGAFVGSAADDAAIARAQHSAAQTQKLQEEVAARDALAALYSGFDPSQGEAGYDSMAPQIAANMVRAGYTNPSMATIGSILPGLSDAQRARNHMAAGKTVGKADYFSPEDRDTNAVYEVGAGERAVRADGSTITPLSPLYEDTLVAKAEKDRASAAKTAKGGGKIPKLGPKEQEEIMKGLARAFGYDDGNEFLADINSNPELGMAVQGHIGQAWDGNIANTIAGTGQFLNTIPQPEDVPWYLGGFGSPRRFEGAQLPTASAQPQAAPQAAQQPAPQQSIKPGTKAVNKATGQVLTFNGQAWVE